MTTISAVIPPQILLSGSTLYANQGSIYALEVASGRICQKYPIAGIAFPTIVNDVLYLNVSHHPDYFVQAIRGGDGALLWSYRVEGRLSQAPAIADGVAYVSTIEGSIYALQASDGTLLWHVRIDLGPDVPSYLGPIVATAPTVINNIVYLAPYANHPLKPFIYAFRAEDGTLLWQMPLPEVSSFPFAGVDGILYFNTFQGGFALRIDDGSLLWQQNIGANAQVCSPPLVLNGKIYLRSSEWRRKWVNDRMISGQHEHIGALRASDGSLLWQQSLGETPDVSHPTELTIIDDFLYCGVNDGILSAYRVVDGTPVWSYQTGGTFLSGPTGTSGAVYVGANDGCVYALQAADGVLLWRTFVSTAVTAAASISVNSGSITIESDPR